MKQLLDIQRLRHKKIKTIEKWKINYKFMRFKITL